MKVISHVIFAVPLLEGNPPPEIIERWARGLGNKAEFIYRHLKAKIPDKTKFGQRIAAVSSREYRPFVDPDFINKGGEDKEGILASQADKLKRSYGKYRLGVEQAYLKGQGQVFQKRVESARERYGRGMALWSLPFTGTKVSGPGPAVLAQWWLTGEDKASGYLAGAQLKRGKPILVTSPYLRHAFKAALMPRLVQAGASILKMNFDRPTVKEQNDRTNQVVQGLVDRKLRLIPFKTGGRSRVDYRVTLTGFYLEIKVSQKS